MVETHSSASNLFVRCNAVRLYNYIENATNLNCNTTTLAWFAVHFLLFTKP
ncbi:hypothetical protein FLA105535_04920 [Flavobacterium bizetiae]|nr:hypothetical protein FLA105535_04920 [Flavobacterium bizetiae]